MSKEQDGRIFWYMTYSYVSFSSCQFENLTAYVLRNAETYVKRTQCVWKGGTLHQVSKMKSTVQSILKHFLQKSRIHILFIQEMLCDQKLLKYSKEIAYFINMYM